MPNPIMRLFRHFTYSDALKDIFEKEKELVREWEEKWKGSTDAFEHGLVAVPPSDFDSDYVRHGNLFLSVIWDDIKRLEVESHKLSQIENLLEKEERNLSPEERKALRQLRKKLNWKSLERTRNNDLVLDLALNKRSKKTSLYEQKKDLEIREEIKFWHLLFEEKESVKARMQKQKREIQQLKNIAKKTLDRLEGGDPRWKNHVDKFMTSFPYSWHIHRNAIMAKVDKKGNLAHDSLKYVYGKYLVITIEKSDTILDFFKRAEHLFAIIEKRLEQMRP